MSPYWFLIVLAVLSGCSRDKEITVPGAVSRNSSSLITSAQIAPGNPTSASTLIMQYSKNLSEGGGIECRFRWYVDGSPVLEVTGNSLDPSFFTKGSVIEGEVIPVVDAVEKDGFRTQPVTIMNTAPTVVSIELPTVPVFADDSITVQAQGSDIDRNDTVTFLYQWEVNGKAVPGAENQTFETTGVKKKSMISVMVTPFDGEAKGLPLRSPTSLVLSNRNPEITSDPPSGITGSDYSYTVTALDKDGDRLAYRLVTAPPGMTIDSGGTIHWTVPGQVAKAHEVPVKVAVDDGDGGVAYQEFSLYLESK